MERSSDCVVMQLFLCDRSPLRQALESLERVVDEHPVFVRHFTVLRHRS